MSRTSYLRRPLTALLMAAALAASVLMAAVVLASPAQAASLTVTNTNDSGDGSLRKAIIDANTSIGVADTINFAPSLSGQTITLTSALPPITDVAGLTIDGGSTNITISGDNKYRVFEVFHPGGAGSNAGKLTLSNLTVADGYAPGVGGDGKGGAIHNSGTLEVINSTLSGNSAFNSGGAIHNYGLLKVINSTLSGNSASGFAGGGIHNQNGLIEVINSTLSGNSALRHGGGIYNVSGLDNSTPNKVINSTLSGNSVANGDGGGIYNTDCCAGLEVINSTLFDNSATGGSGGGIHNTPLGTATLKNTIVAKSRSGGDCVGSINNGGYNLASDTSCGFPTQNSSKDPILGPLADNGGPTKTHALLAGSPAIDKGNAFGATTDQRGLVRPSNFVGIVNAADGSDIGAFELQAPPTQPDTTPPKVTSTVPPLVNEIAPTINVKATFSEDMLRSSITGQTFKLFKKGSTTKKAATVSYNADTDTAKLDPTNNLSRGVTYKAVVTTGAKDLADNQLDQNGSTTGLQQKVWYFTVDN